ncbi:MAG: hypothetical protein LBH01_01060 [Verrucomicrobiales bacterium]|jgi:hypothetical protein|nr:hypothetical protein [Verrucomicrobiales bacterium]
MSNYYELLSNKKLSRMVWRLGLMSREQAQHASRDELIRLLRKAAREARERS